MSKHWLIVTSCALLSLAWAITPQEGWDLIARAESGDRTALQTLIQSYQAQDPQAAAGLGVLYLDGIVYPRDLDKARQYFEYGYGQGGSWAGFWLAVLYANGMGVPANLDTALKYAQSSADRGYVGGKLTTLILRLAKGEITYDEFARQVQAEAPKYPEDPVALGYMGRVRAVQASQTRDSQEQTRLISEARDLFRKSSERGYFIYRSFYMQYLYFGIGGPPDQPEAIRLARPLVGLLDIPTGLVVYDLYFGNVQTKDTAKACDLASQYFAYPNLRGSVLRTVYGLCLMDSGKKVEGYAHLLFASTDSIAARALSRERGKDLSPQEIEQAKALLKNLP